MAENIQYAFNNRTFIYVLSVYGAIFFKEQENTYQIHDDECMIREGKNSITKKRTEEFKENCPFIFKK